MSSRKAKVTKNLPKYLILGIVLFALAGIIYVLSFQPQLSQQQTDAQNVKIQQYMDAQTGDKKAAGLALEEQIAQAEKERKSQKAFSEFTGKAEPTPPLTLPGPNLNQPIAAPAPPKVAPVMDIYQDELRNAQQASMMPEVDDFSTPSSNTGIAAVFGQQNEDTPSNADSGKKDGSNASNAFDDKWKSPVSPVTLPEKAPSRYLLQEGSIIDVVLLGSINTQNPGRVQFRVVSDVYDSLGGRNLLVPKGSKLIGAYGTPPNFGLDRVPISINRLVFSDGRSVMLRDTDISDAMGAIGAPAEFHSNIWRAIGPAALVAWIGFKVDESLQPNQPAAPSGSTTAAQTVSQSTIPEIQKRILQRYGAAEPYYTKEYGERLSIIVASDIAIPPEN